LLLKIISSSLSTICSILVSLCSKSLLKILLLALSSITGVEGLKKRKNINKVTSPAPIKISDVSPFLKIEGLLFLLAKFVFLDLFFLGFSSFDLSSYVSKLEKTETTLFPLVIFFPELTLIIR